jgi:hypothetical protein
MAGTRTHNPGSWLIPKAPRISPPSSPIPIFICVLPDRTAFEGLAHGMREKELNYRLTRVELPARASDDELRSVLPAAGPRVSATNYRVEHDARAVDA